MVQFIYRKPGKKVPVTSRKYYVQDISAAVRRFYAERESNEAEILKVVKW